MELRGTAKVALFGGTFDPVHNTHILIARAAADRFGLERVLFIPAARPPHKTGARASYKDRARMLELACAGDARFEVSRIEEEAVPSYSIDTVERLKAQGLGPLSFIIGADAFAEVATWHRWKDMVKAVEFIVVTRPGAQYSVSEGARVRELDGIESPVSSSSIRARLMVGEFDVPVADAVLSYIRETGIYRV